MPAAREWKMHALWLEYKAGPQENMHPGGEGSEETGVKIVSMFATNSFSSRSID